MAELPTLRVLQMVLWATGRLKRFRVFGESMAPTLAHGQEVLVKPLRSMEGRSAVLPGDILLITHPLKKDLQLLKRCSHWDGSKICVLGDNPEDSTDSRHFGNILPKFIIGKVVCTFP